MTSSTTSLQLYTLRQQIAQDLESTLQKVAELGFSNVEPYAYVERADEFAALFAKFGLSAPTGHASLIGQDVSETLESAMKLGIKTLIEPFTPAADWKNSIKIQYFAEEINRVSKIASRYGIKVAYHNHSWELSEKVGGEIAFDYFIARLDPEVLIELDCYWCEVGGVDSVEFLRKHKSRIMAVHVKDGTKDGNKENQCPAGQGQIPVQRILAETTHALRVIEFDEYNGDLFEGIAQSLEFIEEAQLG